MNLVHLLSQISRSWHENGLLCDIDYSFKSMLDDVMLSRSWPWKVGHDLDLKFSF